MEMSTCGLRQPKFCMTIVAPCRTTQVVEAAGRKGTPEPQLWLHVRADPNPVATGARQNAKVSEQMSGVREVQQQKE